MKKRLAVLFAAAVLGVASLAGCGKKAEAQPAAADASAEDAIDMEAEKNKIQDSLTYMGGLTTEDPADALQLAMFRDNDGNLITLVAKEGTVITYGMFSNGEGELEDGTVYTTLLQDDTELGYGYYFGEGDEDSFLMDVDGVAYVAAELSEDVARDLVNDTL